MTNQPVAIPKGLFCGQGGEQLRQGLGPKQQMMSPEANSLADSDCAVLVVAHEEDEHADQLATLLAERGRASVFRLSRDQLPGQAFAWGPDGHVALGAADIGYGLPMSGLWRRPAWPNVDAYAPDYQAFALDECVDAFDGAMSSLLVRWITPPHVLRRAELKLYQLATARLAGLRIPQTLVTNDRRRAIEFVSRVPRAVAKPVRYGLISAESPLVAWTTELSVPELSDLAGPPIILQERLDPALQIRAVTVGDRTFVATLKEDATDWRATLDNHSQFKRAGHRLGTKVTRAAQTVAAALSVGFSAQDWILTLAGHLYFLEANPNGQWLFLDELWDGGITSAIAETLELFAMSEGRAA